MIRFYLWGFKTPRAEIRRNEMTKHVKYLGVIRGDPIEKAKSCVVITIKYPHLD